MPMPAFLSSVLDWLRLGYPDGIPETDYFPLLALLSNRLAKEEITQITEELIKSGELVSNTDIGVTITRLTNELPLPEDVNRVRARLAAGGWPLADPHHVDEGEGPDSPDPSD